MGIEVNVTLYQPTRLLARIDDATTAAATVSDLTSAARNLGITEDEIEACNRL